MVQIKPFFPTLYLKQRPFVGQFTLGKAMNWKFLLFKTPIILSKVQAVIFTLVEGSVYSYGYVSRD